MSGTRVDTLRFRYIPHIGMVLVAGLLAGGCATKGYVKDEIKEVEDRVARVETTANDASVTARAARDLAMQGDEKAQQALAQAEMAKDMALGNIRREDVRTEAIYFGFDSAMLTDDARLALNDVAEDLRANPNYMVLLAGYADPTGDETYNLQLADRRAAAVRLQLAQLLGKDFVRVATIGLGELEPDVEGRSSNRESRRVDAQIVRPIPMSEEPVPAAEGPTD
jgi:peptidoglycan-associated lipoprotein